MEDYLYNLRFELDKVEWRARGRRAQVMRLLERHWVRPPAARLLDVGCGSGVLVEDLARYGEAWGVDISEAAVAFCHDRGLERVRAGGATALPFADSSFDLVTAVDVVEHVEDDALAAREMHRVCRIGGVAIVIVPAFGALWSTRDVRLCHFRRYRLSAISGILSQAGFEVLKSSYTDLFLLPALYLAVRLAKRRGRAPDLQIDSVVPGRLASSLLKKWMDVEGWLLAKAGLPLGVSAVVVAKKPA